MEEKKISHISGHLLPSTVAALTVMTGIFCQVQSVSAATFYLGPATGNFIVGQTFSVDVLVASKDQPINAVQGVLNYPTNILDLVQIIQPNSRDDFFWIQEPVETKKGRVNFEGVFKFKSGGFQGGAGQIVRLTFKSKAPGTANISFASGAILAHDGKGTNVLTGMGSGSYTFAIAPATQPVEVPATPPEVPNAPSSPLITSSSHPDANTWYAKNAVNLSWSLPPDATDVAVVVDQKQQTVPQTGRGLVTNYTSDTLKDGIWYAHVRFKNAVGWGATLHRLVLVDTTNPEKFELKPLPKVDDTDPFVRAPMVVYDATSGIAYYEVEVDGNAVQKWYDDGSHVFSSNPVPPGQHVIRVKAVDRAGNYEAAQTNVDIKPLPAPIIDYYPKELRSDEVFSVIGKSFPGAQLNLWMKFGRDGVPTLTTSIADADGVFSVVYDRTMETGVYRFWVEAQDPRGAKSFPTDQEIVVVTTSAIEEVGRLSRTILFLASTLSTFCTILILLFWRKREYARKLEQFVKDMSLWEKWLEVKHKRRAKAKQITETAKKESHTLKKPAHHVKKK